jgi:hypothetical protein
VDVAVPVTRQYPAVQATHAAFVVAAAPPAENVPVEQAVPAVVIDVVDVTLCDTLTVYTPAPPALWNVRVCDAVAVCPPTLIVPVQVPVHGFVESANTVDTTHPDPDPDTSVIPL